MCLVMKDLDLKKASSTTVINMCLEVCVALRVPSPDAPKEVKNSVRG